MRACENPKCPFHIEAPDEAIRAGWFNFQPHDFTSSMVVPQQSSTPEFVRTGSIRVHPYGNLPALYLCDVCHEAVQMILWGGMSGHLKTGRAGK